MIKRMIYLTFLIFLAAVFFGCANNSAEKQALAIEQAIMKQEKDTEAFYYFEYDDIVGQISDPSSKKTGNDGIEYELHVSVPEIMVFSADELAIAIPDFDLNAPDPNTFAETFKNTAREVLEDAMLTTKEFTYRDQILHVTLKKEKGDWVAVLHQIDIDTMCDSISQDIVKKSEQLLLAQEAYQKLLLADSLDLYLEKHFPDIQYLPFITIESIEKATDGYAVTITYPDPQWCYETAAQQCYTSYEADGRVLFEEVRDSDIENAFRNHLEQSLTNAPNRAENTFIVSSDAANNDYTAEFAQELASTRDHQLSNLLSRINSEFVVSEVDKPKTGVLTGSNEGESINIQTSSELSDIHITFYKLSGTDLSEEGTLALSAFILAGDSLTIYLPTGNYKMIQGSGETWYGEPVAFGPNGSYDLADLLMTVESNYTYTLTLYGVSDGNLPTKKIPYPYGE